MHARSLAIASLVCLALGAGCAAESDSVGDDVACTLAVDYWRAHESMWPVDELTLGDQTYDQNELMPILSAVAADDASQVLAAQLAAALLNLEVGAAPDPELANVIADSHDWLAEVADADGRLPFDVTEEASAGAHLMGRDLAEQLRAFNDGTRGLLRCQLD